MAKGVDKISPERSEKREHRQITHHLRGGTQAMRRAGTLYLPQEPKESSTAYHTRLSRSTLTNFYRQAADTFIGRILKKDPQLLDETPTQVQDIVDDIDNAGTDLPTFLRQSLTHAVDDGEVYWLADAPEYLAPTIETAEGEVVEVPRTRAVDEALGLRPFVNIIKADNLLFTRRDSRNELTMIRYRTWDQRPDPDDEFNDIEIEQIVVLDMVSAVNADGEATAAEPRMRKRVYERADKTQNSNDEDVEWEIVHEVVTEFTQIPLAHMKVTEDASPLFIDLGNLNVRHWQSQSDQANIVHVIRVPILFAVGLVDETTQKPQNITIAANSVVHGEPGAKLEYVEHSGDAAEVGQVELDKLVEDMVRMGTEIILNQRTGGQTATARALDQAEADTLMTIVAGLLENAIAELFTLLAMIFGEPIEEGTPRAAGGINLNKDFTLATLDASVIQQLLALYQAGGLSTETLWQELQRMGLLSEDFDPEMEPDRIEADKDNALERERQMMELVAETSQPEDEDDDDPPDE